MNRNRTLDFSLDRMLPSHTTNLNAFLLPSTARIRWDKALKDRKCPRSVSIVLVSVLIHVTVPVSCFLFPVSCSVSGSGSSCVLFNIAARTFNIAKEFRKLKRQKLHILYTSFSPSHELEVTFEQTTKLHYSVYLLSDDPEMSQLIFIFLIFWIPIFYLFVLFI